VTFYDKATNRAFCNVFLMVKGTMVGRAEVLETFAAMLADPLWGVPGNLYFDNGSEFQWDAVANDISTLRDSPLATSEVRNGLLVGLNEGHSWTAITRARPYNAAAKGSIEGFFSTLSRVWLPMLPGYIGPNRTRAKKEHQGRPPAPYPGTIEDFRADFARLIAGYHAERQTGHLDGESPNERMAKHVANGWQATIVEPAGLAFVLAEPVSRGVSPGGVVSVEGRRLQSDTLIPLAGTGKRAALRVSLLKGRRVFVADESGTRLIGEALPTERYPDGDRDGAVRQGEMNRTLKRELAAKAAGTDRLDKLAVTDQRTSIRTPPPVANEPKACARVAVADLLANPLAASPAPDADAEAAEERELLEELNRWRKAG
jgi:hypothetical protein